MVSRHMPDKSVAEAIRDMRPEHITDRKMFKENLRVHLKRLVQSQLSSKPVIVTTVLEV